MEYQREKDQIIQISKKMYHSGMINMFEGNVSIRYGNTILITPSQQSKDCITPDMILQLDCNGTVCNPSCGQKPSSEVAMHLAVYRMRPDVHAIIHNHSTYATAYAMAGMPIVSDAHPELNFTFGQVPLCPYGTPGTDQIYHGLEPLLRDYNIALLENHGVLSVAKDLLTALAQAEAVEKLAHTLLISRLLGGEKALPPLELEKMRLGGLKKRHAEMIPEEGDYA